jgi:hypothetical protein
MVMAGILSFCASAPAAGLMSTPVHIAFRRTGGFAGLTFATDTDTDHLPAAYEGLVRDLLAGRTSGAAADAPAQPDRFTYELQIDDGEQARTVRWQETAVPENVRPLIAELTSQSSPAS